MYRWVVLLITVVLVAGCSDTKDKDLDQGVDSATDFTSVATGDGAKQAKYPAGPYGTKAGETAANLQFLGYMDPKTFCKDAKDKKMDTSKVRPISFQSYYLGDSASGCAKYKPKLMWVMVSAGWCSPCKVEVNSTQKQYEAGSVPPGLEMLNIVFEDTSSAPASESFTKTWIGQFGLTFPVAMDPSFKMGAYFSRAAVPFNMLIDTRTMKIYYRQVGGSLTSIGKKITEFMANNK